MKKDLSQNDTHFRQLPYFGIASFLLGLNALVVWTLLLFTAYTRHAEDLLVSMPSVLVDPALQGIVSIAGIVTGAMGLFIDRKKVFSILGLALFIMVVIVFLICDSLTILH